MGIPPIPPDEIYASPRWKSFSNISEDVNLVALGGGPCRRIQVITDGVLELVPASPLEGQTSDTTPTLPAGTVLDVQATHILASGTGNLAFIVFW